MTHRPPEKRLKVLYILSRGRSGSTILDLALGTLDGFWSTGELRLLFPFGMAGEQACACGSRVNQCALWSRVLAQVTEIRDPGLATILEWDRELFGLRAAFRVLASRRRRGLEAWETLGRYASLLGGLYGSLARHTGSRVVVDSSKRAVHPGVLGLVPGIEPYAVHLVRDPRAVNFSEATRVEAHRLEDTPPFLPVWKTAGWVVYNLLIECVLRRYLPGRWVRVRYEDFAARPGPVLEAIGALVGEVPGLDEGMTAVEVRHNHMVAGNRARHSRGTVQLQEDRLWRREMPAWDARVTTLIASGLLGRYGYPLDARPRLKLYGERNSGTRYLERLLRRNLRVRLLPGTVPRLLDSLSLGNEWVKDLYFRKTFGRNLGWKHMLVPEADWLPGDTFFVCLTKDPYSWLLSLYRRPHHARRRYSSFQAFLAAPWESVGRENSPPCFANPMDLWNQKTASYLRLARARPTLLVTYEELLADPPAVVARIGELSEGRPRSGPFRNISRSTKAGGRDYAFCRDYYLDRRWARELEPGALLLINEHLDAGLMARLGYPRMEPS
ncbi:MAG: hypothetical protein HY319_14630 [Armatimonadetes bacterium]|nr:hypothetical protein [Armatimonadota bacterium]